MGKRPIGMGRFRWKDIPMRNKVLDMDLILLIQDRTVGLFLHDTVMNLHVTRNARGS
jgi:hypothetical protein